MTAVDEYGAQPVAGNLFDICAALDVSIGRQTDILRKAMAAKPREPQPVQYRNAQSAAIPGSGPLILRFAGPDQGHIWHVRSIVCAGATPVTSIAGRADVFVSASDLRVVGASGLGAIGSSDWRDQAPTLPSIAFYSNGDIPLRFNEELYVIFSNGTPSQQVIATVQIEDIEEGNLEITWDF